MAQYNPQSAVWQGVVRFQADKVNVWLGVRNCLGVGLPLAVGAAFGSLSAGLIMSTGALNVAFRDNDAPYRQRARKMFAASVLAGISVFVGSVTGGNYAVAVLVAGVWAFAAGMLVALGAAIADLGMMSLLMLVVYGAVPLSAERAAAAGLLAFAGGLFQALLSIAAWPLRRYAAERAALGNLYHELSRAAASPPMQATESPLATSQSIQAQVSLATLAQDRTLESERFQLLLSHAEQMRLGLLVLGRLRIRVERENAEGPESQDRAARMLDQCMRICSRLLDCIDASLQERGSDEEADQSLRELDASVELLRESSASQTIADAVTQVDALAAHLRAAQDIAAHATPSGMARFEERESEKPWNLRLHGGFATLRANLNLGSATFRHAVRLAICVWIGDALGRGFGLQRSYW